MQIEQASIGAVRVLAPIGRIDTTTSAAVEEALHTTVDDGGRELVVDLEGVDYISSAGLRVFLVLAKRLRNEHGRLVLCGMPEPVRQVFHLAGFLPLFEIERTRQAAVARAASPS
jgi:stage II sporulation protein AA (anti-sigma F factor antagonist)